MTTLEFTTPKQWETWLAKNHAKAPEGVWLRFFKKASGKPSLTYQQALDVALCYGWIDGQGRSEGEISHVQRFTPRRARSVWSKRNTEHVERLIAEGRMKPAGLAQIEAAKRDGRWARAYDSPSTSSVPEDFLDALRKNRKAQAFFSTLDKRNTYAITHRLQTAKKPETRERRMKAIIQMLAEKKKLHP